MHGKCQQLAERGKCQQLAERLRTPGTNKAVTNAVIRCQASAGLRPGGFWNSLMQLLF